jgi:hypothetical protein
MDATHTVFRRLAERDANRFIPLYKHPVWKVILLIVVITVCIRWITH